jgi:hexosaminidase
MTQIIHTIVKPLIRRGLLAVLMVLVFYPVQAKAIQATDTATHFKIRAFHIDMRIQVMKLGALKKLACQLHQQGINTLIMEWEGAYPYRDETLISNRYAYKRSEITDFVNYCHSMKMDVIPLQQTFGHVEYILKHYKYAYLREDDKDFSQVCPTELDSCRALFTKLLKDMADTHGSPYIHIGGDETFLLGHCEKCQRKVAKVGLSGLYFDYIKMICDIVVSLGKKPVLWADIALHYPEKIHLLPKQTIFIDWNYGWDLNYFGNHTQLLNSGYTIWGAPALRSEPDNFYITKWKTHFENINSFIPEMRRLNYQGAVMTSWSTSGAYSTVFDSNNDPVALYPIRRVYPLAGFNLLINAYTTALKTNAPLNIDAFINNYCKNRFGFNRANSERFKEALFMAPYTVINGKVQANQDISLARLTDSTGLALRLFTGLKPRFHKKEYAHYVLMTEIRYFYLKVLQVEAQMNGKNFNLQTAHKFIPVLTGLKQKSMALNKAFGQLNGDFLCSGEIEAENELRNAKLNSLYQQVLPFK